MQAYRIKLKEPEGETITLDVWCEMDSKAKPIAVRHLSFFGEWMDEDGDTYPFALRYDGVLDYGVWSEDTAKGSHLKIHGSELLIGAKFAYQSKNYQCDFTVVSISADDGRQTIPA